MVSDELVIKFARAIAHAEGFGVDKTNLPTRCNNPGDLAAGDVGHGTARSAGYGAADITIYATEVDGWSALYRQVRRMLTGGSRYYTLDMRLADVGMTYARSGVWSDNFVSSFGAGYGMPVTTSTTLLELVNFDLQSQGKEPVEHA